MAWSYNDGAFTKAVNKNDDEVTPCNDCNITKEMKLIEGGCILLLYCDVTCNLSFLGISNDISSLKTLLE